MNKKHVVGGLFVLVVLIAVGGYATVVVPEGSVAPAPAPAVEAPPPSSDDGVCSASLQPGEDPSAGFVRPEEAACARCPDGSPQCWSDKQCDTVCGGKGLGDCVRINSCYQCCYCAL